MLRDADQGTIITIPQSIPGRSRATPYAWVTLLNGSTTVKGRTVDVNVDFNDLMDLVRRSEIPKDLFALMGYLEARNGRLSLFADFDYLKIGLNGTWCARAVPMNSTRPSAHPRA